MDRLPQETPRNPEINEATPLLHAEVCVIDADLYAIGGAAGFTDELVYEPQTDLDSIVQRLILAWLPFSPSRLGEDSEFFSPRALHAMLTALQQIKAERDVLPESEVIVQGLTEFMVDYMYQLQLMISDGEEHITEKAFKARVTEIMAEGWQQILDGFDEEAWLQFPPSRSARPDREDSEFLDPRALHAMSTAWRKIKTEKDVLPESEVIVQGLTESMVDHMYQIQLREPGGEAHVIDVAFTEHVTKIVAKGWQQILDGIEEEDAQERARIKRERRQRIRERLGRRREVAGVLWFYEPFARMNHYVPLDCRIFCINLCLCCSVFIFQVLIPTLLLPWPLSIGIMGGLYMTQCPMSYLMPYVMMASGVAGTIALLTRLSFAIYKKFSGNEIKMCPWILLKVIEFVFLDFLSIHVYYFFSKTPSFILGSPEYCNEAFYNFVYWISYISIALASVWLLVYFIKGILTWQLRKFSLRPW